MNVSGTGRGRLKTIAGFLRRTPLHPQWLMPAASLSEAMRHCHGTVLDIGSAAGWLKHHLAADARYVSLDYPTTAVGLYGTRPDVFGDAHQLPFPAASIDAVACLEVLEHVRDPDRVLAEVFRVLVPAGVAELSMPFLYPIHDAPHDYQRWTLHGWKRSLVSAGFHVECLRPRNHPLHAAAVVACLSLTAPFMQASRWSVVWRLPAIVLLVPMINVAAWVLAGLWPAWEGATNGYLAVARKPA